VSARRINGSSVLQGRPVGNATPAALHQRHSTPIECAREASSLFDINYPKPSSSPTHRALPTPPACSSLHTKDTEAITHSGLLPWLHSDWKLQWGHTHMSLLSGRRQTRTCLNLWKEIQKHQYTSNQHFLESEVWHQRSSAGRQHWWRSAALCCATARCYYCKDQTRYPSHRGQVLVNTPRAAKRFTGRCWIKDSLEHPCVGTKSEIGVVSNTHLAAACWQAEAARWGRLSSSTRAILSTSAALPNRFAKFSVEVLLVQQNHMALIWFQKKQYLLVTIALWDV